MCKDPEPIPRKAPIPTIHHILTLAMTIQQHTLAQIYYDECGGGRVNIFLNI
jgi:hypothetical protein